MDIKKLLIGGIIGGILFFLLGWLIYGNLLMTFMKNNPGTATGVDRTEMDFMYLVIGNLASGFLMAYIFMKANVNSLSNGLVTGGIIGVLMAVAYDATMYGVTNILSKKAMMADVLASLVISAVVGAVVGLVNSKLKPA